MQVLQGKLAPEQGGFHPLYRNNIRQRFWFMRVFCG